MYSLLLKLARARLNEQLPLGHLSKLKETPPETKNAIYEFAVQEHHAKKAGKHYDLRLGDPITQKGYSWAGRYWPQPGEARLFNLQPVHNIDYFNFEGELKGGYGAGKVKLFKRSKAIIVEAQKNKIKFVIPDRQLPEEYVLIKQSGDKWLLINVTRPGPGVPKEHLVREKFKDIRDEHLPKYINDTDYVMQRKDDGIHTAWVISPNKQIRAYSVPREETQEIFDHTYKFPDIINVRGKPAHGLTVIKGETFVADKKTGQALPLSTTTSVLMSDPIESMRKLVLNNADLKRTAFDILYYKNKYVANLPYIEKLKLLKEIASEYKFDIPHTAITPEQKIKLLEDIKNKRIKETKEGVVFRHITNNTDPLRYKFTPEWDVYVIGITEGKGSLQGAAAGGFVYSLEKGGPPAGVVGSGFTYDERVDMFRNPTKYIGRVAKVKAKEQLESGALRQPVFVSWHPEK